MLFRYMRLIHVEQSLGCGNSMPPRKSDSLDEEINPCRNAQITSECNKTNSEMKGLCDKYRCQSLDIKRGNYDQLKGL